MKKYISTLVLLLLFMLSACQQENEPTAEERFADYTKLWEEKKFEQMYAMLAEPSKEEFGKEEAVQRFKNIYDDLGIENVKVSFAKKEEEEKNQNKKETTIPFKVTMDSIAGEISFNYEAKLLKEEREEEGANWYVDWNQGFIFPQIKDGQGIGVATTKPERGEIFDRNGKGLAINAEFREIGVVPQGFGEKEAETKKQIAELLNMTVEQIDNALSAGWVKPDSYVPLKKIPAKEEEKISKLTSLPPVTTKETTGRYYPYGKAAAHLTGHIDKITAEDLEEMDAEKYNANSMIGRKGLELVFEKKLSGTPGAKIYAKNENGENTLIAQKEVVHGEDVNLTIDAELQKKLHESYQKKAGTATAINPKTGEALALVSYPAYDPNNYTYGFDPELHKKLQENTLQPLLNRFSKTYAPGSVIKPVTAGILLTSGTIDPQETMKIDGLQWAKEDGSWGNYKITRVSESEGPVDITNAMIRSDNIFFARAAIRMKPEEFRNGLANFGFSQEIPFEYPIQASQISNEDTFRDDLLVANTAYGQGELEMSLLHLAISYTPLFNEGNLLDPSLVKTEEAKAVWKENATDPQYNDLIKNALREVVVNPKGTARAADIDDVKLSGKTGTAELKRTLDEKGEENGWFVTYPTDNPELLVAMMVENVEEGSSEVVEQAAGVFQDIR